MLSTKAAAASAARDIAAAMPESPVLAMAFARAAFSSLAAAALFLASSSAAAFASLERFDAGAAVCDSPAAAFLDAVSAEVEAVEAAAGVEEEVPGVPGTTPVLAVGPATGTMDGVFAVRPLKTREISIPAGTPAAVPATAPAGAAVWLPTKAPMIAPIGAPISAPTGLDSY